MPEQELIGFKAGNEISNIQLSHAEDAIENLTKALGISEKDLLTILEDGFKLNPKVLSATKVDYFLDEMKATFDAY
jgi:hypothetical protein